MRVNGSKMYPMDTGGSSAIAVIIMRASGRMTKKKVTGRSLSNFIFFTGKLIIYRSNGTTYVGRWVNDQRNGEGILEVPHKVRYEGFFKDGLFIHGVGVEILPNGKKYDGKFQEAHYHGEGSLCWPDGTIYEGMFQQGRATGRGTMKKANGVTYVGDFQHGWYEGIGLLTFTDGSSHEGGFSKGLRHGKGTYSSGNGRKFKQVWINGEKDEHCTVF
jgi:hypothetical protein